ncbi:unnamed protein product [Triticum turgidum subsp. durum]|uniref:Uncharacterized protein n=1 Tax=Triticum turgidum subsp. durum TaxID=4567 RepID=A0A9R0RMZ4_TRITD|nr:unnamed protein product [Triticum turgidum subsp. durum]
MEGLLMLLAVSQMGICCAANIYSWGHSCFGSSVGIENPILVIKDLKVDGLSDLVDTYELLKLGGSDYHGRDDKEEPDIGSVDLPVLAFFRFLEVAQPICCNAIKEIFANTTERS